MLYLVNPTSTWPCDVAFILIYLDFETYGVQITTYPGIQPKRFGFLPPSLYIFYNFTSFVDTADNVG